jgi:alpha-1,6-mannosyltransferase
MSTHHPLRIVRLANFVTARSGGLRTALSELGAGYRAAGHEPILVIPGARHSDEDTPQGRVISVPGSVVPGTGGYRVLLDRPRVARLLASLSPDRLEVSDRSTLRWTGRWARRHGVPSMMVSHESLAGLLRLGPNADPLADWLNRRTAVSYDQVVCTTGWAAAEFDRVSASNVRQIPLGVDLDAFHPDRRDERLRTSLAAHGFVLVVHCGRLSVEKRPARSLEAVAALNRAGVRAVLIVAGDGPLRSRLARQAVRDHVPVKFLGHVADRVRLAALLATADVVLAPGPVETFGLAALEALASGTPVVADAASALLEVIGPAGITVPGSDPLAWADAVRTLIDRPADDRRAAARERAEQFPWSAAIEGFLRAHHAPTASEQHIGPLRR